MASSTLFYLDDRGQTRLAFKLLIPKSDDFIFFIDETGTDSDLDQAFSLMGGDNFHLETALVIDQACIVPEGPVQINNGNNSPTPGDLVQTETGVAFVVSTQRAGPQIVNVVDGSMSRLQLGVSAAIFRSWRIIVPSEHPGMQESTLLRRGSAS